MAEPAVTTPIIRLFGGATLEVGGVPATGRAVHRHRIALLALLVVGRGRAITRDKLIGYLWPERDGEAGRNLLKVAVHGIRKEFGEAAIRTSGDQLIGDVTLLVSDVSEFLSAVETGDDEAVATRYRGAFLDGFYLKDAEDFERWVDGQRLQFATEFVASVERLAQKAEAASDPENATRWYRALLATDPYRADIAQRFVRVLVAYGDRANAIQFAESFIKRREDDLAIGDEEGIVALARSAPITRTAANAASNTAVTTTVNTGANAATNTAIHAAPARVSAQPREGFGRRITDEAPVATTAERSFGATDVTAPIAVQPEVHVSNVALDESARRDIRYTKPFYFAIAGALLIPLVLIALLKRSNDAAPTGSATPATLVATKTPTIAILPFRVSGAESTLAYLQDGMSELLAAEFTGEGSANAIDPAIVSRQFARATSTTGDVDQQTAIAIARQLGATQVLFGSVVGTRSRLTVSVSIQSIDSGAARPQPILVEGSADSLATLIGSIAARLLSRDAGAWRLSANEPGTTSSAALRAFIDGRAAYKHAHDDVAFLNFARAIDLDSTFVLAAYWLTVNSKLTRPLSETEAQRAYRLAWQQQSRLGPDRRELLQAMFGPTGPGTSTSVEQIHQAIERATRSQPNSPEAWFLLGDLYFHRGSLMGFANWTERARNAFEHAVSLDTVLGSVSHLATLAYMDGDQNAHARWLSQLERLAPNDGFTARERYVAAITTKNAANIHATRTAWVQSGQAYRDTYDGFPWAIGVFLPQPEIDSLLATMAAMATTDEQRRVTIGFTKSAAMNAGQPERAEQARRLYYANDPIGHDFDLLTYVEFDSAAAERLNVARGTSEKLPNERTCEIVLSRLRREDTTGAAQVAKTLRAVRDPANLDAPVCGALIDAIVVTLPPNSSTTQLARIDSLLRTNPPSVPSIWVYDLALAYARHREYRTAAIVAGRRMIPRSARLAVSLRDQGRWAALAGDNAMAIRAWRQYLALRSHPEPSKASEVAGIRAQLAKLEASTGQAKGDH